MEFNNGVCVTRGLRSMTIFRRYLNTTNYSRFSGMSHLTRAGGVASTHLDFFHDSVPSFRKKRARFPRPGSCLSAIRLIVHPLPGLSCIKSQAFTKP
ncbi:hypothetical protein J6590_027230 [Homalodisca vitripennis]|nr:hypothetical protein J6590_027230 [Homalodisca vitripennis]